MSLEDNKKQNTPLDFRNIKNEKELDQVFDIIRDQGFYISGKYEAHRNKLQSIISKANTLNVKVDQKFENEIYRMSDYVEAEKMAKEYFSKIKPDDKIKEYIDYYHVITDDAAKTPSLINPSSNEIINWVNFRIKYKLKDGVYQPESTIKIYNLDKKILKISYGKDYDFEQLYILLYGENPNSFSSKNNGWMDLGKFELKVFANGNANIKGDLEPFMKYFLDYIRKMFYQISLVTYKGKTETITRKGLE